MLVAVRASIQHGARAGARVGPHRPLPGLHAREHPSPRQILQDDGVLARETAQPCRDTTVSSGDVDGGGSFLRYQ